MKLSTTRRITINKISARICMIRRMEISGRYQKGIGRMVTIPKSDINLRATSSWRAANAAWNISRKRFGAAHGVESKVSWKILIKSVAWTISGGDYWQVLRHMMLASPLCGTCIYGATHEEAAWKAARGCGCISGSHRSTEVRKSLLAVGCVGVEVA